MTPHFKDQKLVHTQKSKHHPQMIVKWCYHLFIYFFLNFMILKTAPWCLGNCSQDFDHWKLAMLCKLLLSQWRYFTTVGKIKIDLGLTVLISAKYKKHVHWPPCWVFISRARQTALVFFFLLCLLPLCYWIIQNIYWVCTDYTVSCGGYLLWNLLYFLCLLSELIFIGKKGPFVPLPSLILYKSSFGDVSKTMMT